MKALKPISCQKLSQTWECAFKAFCPFRIDFARAALNECKEYHFFTFGFFLGYYITMTNSKYEEEVGPTAVITFSSQGSMTGYFEGYLESIGYKSYGKLVLGKVNHMDRSQRVMFQQDKQNERFADSLDQSVFKKGFKFMTSQPR